MSNYSEDYELDWSDIILNSSYTKGFVGILWPLLAFCGIIGNGLVIYIAITKKKLNDITNCYIFNLAVTDLLFIVFCIPFTTYMFIHTDWLFGVVFCKLNLFMSHASVQSTCLTLTAMTIHRCRLIIRNKILATNVAKIKQRQKNVLIITIFIWITSFLIASPDLLYYTVVLEPIENDTVAYCMMQIGEFAISEIYMKTHRFISIATTYVIPLLIIILSYARLISHLTKNQKSLAKFNKQKDINGEKKDLIEASGRKGSLSENKTTTSKKTPAVKQENQRKDKKKRVTMMVILVTLNFGVCWMPTHLMVILRSLVSNPNGPYLAVLKLVANTLSYLTPVINPCVYAFFNENFRNSFIEIWYQITCRESQNATSSVDSPIRTQKSTSKKTVEV